MKRTVSLLALLTWLCTIAWSQGVTVKGTVRTNKGEPVPYASIFESGTKKGVTADVNGVFSIQVKAGGKLLISAINYETVTVDATEGNMEVTLSPVDEKLTEVVVTALGVRRAKNTLPYAAQQVSGEDISRMRTANAASGLSGKISGLQIIQGNGIGGSTNVVIRGTKSLLFNNQALFIVDGVPIDNTNGGDVSNTSPMAPNQRTGRGGYDYGNAASDINPDDIETINVLKGAAATALYGSRAANGVIMITSKKAKKGLGVTVNSGVIVGSIDKSTFTKYQKEYGSGYSTPYTKDGFYYFDVDGDGQKDYVVPTDQDASYGVRFDPKLLVYHWDAFDPTSPTYHVARPWVAAKNDPSTFYETAVSTNNNIMLDGANDKGSFKLGYTRNSDKGVLPNSKIVKNVVNFGASFKITDRLTAAAFINYSKIDGRGRFGTGYNGRNVNQNFREWYPVNVDIQEQKKAYFRNHQNITWNWYDASSPSGLIPAFTDNYYWTVYQNYETDSRSRVFGNVSLDYKLTDWLGLLARVAVDNYTEIQEERVAVGSKAVGSYSHFERNVSELNYDLMANVDKQLSNDFNLKALAGVNLRRNTLRSIYNATAGGLIVPGIYALRNAASPAPAAVEAYQPKAVDGYFAGATLGFRNFLTLDGTFRRDRSSTLPSDANGYNYYAVSGSWLFSQHLQQLGWLASGKLRVNYATVGNDAPWGSLQDVYDQANPFGSTLLFSLPDSKNNSELKPEKTQSKEIGLEMAFFKNRIGFDASYYQTKTIDQVVPAAISTATGYASKFVNAGATQNKGFEMSLYGTPFKTKDFSWNVNVNFSRNRNKVVSLYRDSKNLLIGSFQGGITINATLGQPYGTIQGATWTMKDGQRLVNANGYYANTSTTSNVIGNINPDWTGGVMNSFKYKNLALSFLIDVRHGGDVFSLDMWYSQYTGVLPESAGLNDLGNPVRNSLADGGGVILPGVTADGKPNEKRVIIDANSPKVPQSTYVYDASYTKLREVALTYQLPARVYSKLRALKGIEFSLIGKNLWIIHKNLPYSDPEENLSAGNIQGYQSGAYPTTRSVGFNIKLKI